ncbi:hypothetical protein G6F64_014214 [Rhizopus arrhizus]|uniref:Uncharacterized protein n=1 Tax=Rhizopus oryzae TaxID=64495 RepID=A0A9P6WTV7_RHIOR|nr:hypothetical protein G6F64_014214 [Rhizopus arrhizus]
MRAAGQRQLAHAGTMAERELRAAQRAIRIADERLQRADAEMIQQQCQRIGLVGGIDRNVQRAICPDEVEGQHAQLLWVQRAALADQILGPAPPPPAHSPGRPTHSAGAPGWGRRGASTAPRRTHRARHARGHRPAR